MRTWQALLCAAAVIIAFGSSACHAQDATAFPVTGKVLMPDGSPAVGAAIEARGHVEWIGWRVQGTATSGADGKFTMQLPMGTYLFCVVSGDLVCFDWAQEINVAKDGSVSKKIEMRLEKGCKVQGSVIDITTSQPVGGMKILTREGDHAESSDSGEWRMVLRKGSQTITATKEGYWWPTVNFSATGDTVRVKVETKPGGTVKGRILNEQGQPIAGARVGTEAASLLSMLATTDADGRFVFGGQDPDAKAELWARADGYDELYSQAVTFPAAQREAQIELTMKRPKVRTISGRVTRQDGTPVKGVKVAYGDGVNFANRVCAWSNKDGNYTIKKADVARSLVMVTCKDLAPSCKPVEADKDAQIDFQLKPGHSVEVHVEDESGNPVAQAGASASMKITDARSRDNLYPIAYGTSDKNGNFKLDSLPEGEVYASIYVQDFDAIESERLKVDRKDYTLVMRKTVPGQICGTVVKDSDGKPITEFNVRLGFSRASRSSGLSPGLVEQGVSFQGADGRFTIKGLTVKEGFAVIVTAPGYMEGSADPVTVKPVSEDTYKDTVVRLRPASAFEGSITAAGTGRPVEGVMVTAWNSPGTDGSYQWDMSHTSLKSVSTHTDAAGKFKFDSMPFAFGMVMLEKPGLARTIVKAVSFSRPLKASMEKGATVTGSIADEQGKVPPGVSLSLEQMDLNLTFRPQIDSDGRFRLEDLPPGECMVLQHKEGNWTKHQAFVLKPGELYQVDWDKQGSVIVDGRVLQHGKPVPHAKINVNSQRRGNWAGSAETVADGSYKLSLFKPGTYFFSCILGEWMDPNHIYSGRTLTLAAGANRVDFSLPCGSISGKLVDKLTGKPLAGTPIRLYVRETWKQNRGRDSLAFAEVEGRWWPENECKTDKNGTFQARNLRAGKWMICVDPGAVPAAVVRLADGEAKSGVVARVRPTGSAKISFAGMKDRPKDAMVVCVDEFGMAHYPNYENGVWAGEVDDLPVGKFKAVATGTRYLPTEVAFQVRADETTNVSIKLTKGPRIVFEPKTDPQEAGVVSIGFKITTLDGKPVLRGTDGLRWGEILTHDPDRKEPAAVTVKPGTYLVKAGAVRGDSRNYGDDPELTGYSGKVTVVNGKDTIVEVPLNR